MAGGLGHYNDGSTGYTINPPPTQPAPAPVTYITNVTNVVTGVNQVEQSYQLYSHPVPLSVGGVVRIGGDIISGPWTENGRSSFIISFGVPADPSGTRELREIAFDSQVIWTGSLIGAGTPAASGFTTEAITCRFYDGNLTQPADSLEVSHFGADAIAYRPQILLAFDNVPLANTKFNKIPYVSAVIADTSGEEVNLGEAFERLAYSPWVGYTSAEFETSGITDGVAFGGLILAQDEEFLGLIQKFGKFYPTWDILQTDKLRIVDRGSNVTPDLIVDKTKLMDRILVNRQGPDAIRKDIELSTIDPDADYSIVPFLATRPLAPIPVTTSRGVDRDYLPIVMDAPTRAAVSTLANYHREQTRKSVAGTLPAFGLEIEPGDLIRVADLDDDFRNETFKVAETTHGANNVVEFVAQAILKCNVDGAEISFVSASSVTYEIDTSQDVNIPSCNVRDMLIAEVMHRDDLTPPAGWTLAAQVSASNVNSPTGVHILSAYYRVAQSGDSGDLTTWTQDSSQRIAVQILAFRKSFGTPHVVAIDADHVDTTSLDTINVPEVDATDDGQMGVMFATSVLATTPLFGDDTMRITASGVTQTTPGVVADNRLCGGYLPMEFGDSTAAEVFSDVAPLGNGWSSISLIIG